MTATIIQTPTCNIKESLQFYTKQGFTVLSSSSPTIVSDGQVVIEINPDKFARAGVQLYAASWQNVIQELERLIPVVKIDKGYLCSDPSGVWIYLIETVTMPAYDRSKCKPSILGNYAGLSLETISIPQAAAIWQLLGFAPKMGSEEQGWLSLTNDAGETVSLMKPNSCPHLFFNPSLSYFNGANNVAIIEKIRALGIPITEEITDFNKKGIVDNIIIRDPAGYGFFVFSD